MKRPGATSAFHVQAAFATAFTVLTSGVFLSGLALYLGAGDLLVSYISMIANICGVSILLFSPLLERARGFRRLAAGLTVSSRLFTLSLVLVPAVVPPGGRLFVFVALMVAAFTLQAQTTVVLNNWLVGLAEGDRRGRYIARRQTVVLSMTVVLSLAGGRVLDGFEGGYLGFALLFSVALAASIAEVLVLLRLPDTPRPMARRAGRLSLGGSMRPYLRFTVYIFLFYLFLTFADSYTTVYMLRYLKLDYVTTSAMQMLISLPQVFLLGFWGRLGDRKGHGFALRASLWFFVGETLFLALSGGETWYVFLPVAFLFAAVGNAGFVVSVFNRRYELLPQENRLAFDNFYSAAIGLAFILGPALGGAVKSLLESSAWVGETLSFGNIRLLYAVSAAALVLLQICAGKRRESVVSLSKHASMQEGTEYELR